MNWRPSWIMCVTVTDHFFYLRLFPLMPNTNLLGFVILVCRPCWLMWTSLLTEWVCGHRWNDLRRHTDHCYLKLSACFLRLFRGIVLQIVEGDFANLSYPTDLYWQTWFTYRWLMIDTHLFVCLFLLPANTRAIKNKTWSLEITLVRSIKVAFKNYISHLKCEIEQFWIGHYFSFSDLLLTIFPCAFTLWKIINVY